MGGDEGLASALLREMKEALRKGEMPSAAEKRRDILMPKSGPGSMHRTEPLHETPRTNPLWALVLALLLLPARLLPSWDQL